MKMSWIDVRNAGDLAPAVVEEALHQRVDGIVVDASNGAPELPPTITRIAFASDYDPDTSPEVDVLLTPNLSKNGEASKNRNPDIELGRFVEVSDQHTLDMACEAARTEKWTVLKFTDPTKIPLEIVLAAANNAEGSVFTIVEDLEEAEIVLGVLEKGSDGIMLSAESVGEATKLKRACDAEAMSVALEEQEVTGIRYVGMGTRACIDTCSQLEKDEGILVGSRSDGMVLACSETHPLPYMPTRPFRVNAGALHSYALAQEGRTNYLSELEAGSGVLAVNHQGEARKVAVGRVKIEARPLLSIDAKSSAGTSVNLIVQDDWHVRVLGPGAAVLNVTELKAGDKVLGHIPQEERHVGLPIDEFCIEQ